MADLLLGVDVGTSSTKATLTRLDGTVVSIAVHEHRPSTPRPGWAEHDPERDWWNGFVAVTRELMPSADGPIAAIGVSGIGPCVLACDADGTPLRHAILYGIDTRATAEIAELAERFGGDVILDRCGSPLTTQAVGPKLLWLRRHEPDIWARTQRLFMASSFLAHRLSGRYILDHHSASQSTPLYDSRAQQWVSEWAEEIAPGLTLPELVWPTEVVGSVTPSAASETGLKAGTPVIAGTIDAWSEAVSVGVDAPGDVMLMYGTTMFLIQVTHARHSWPTLWGTLGVFPGTYCLAGGMATTGAVTDWLRQLTGTPYARLLDEARTVGTGAEGLLMLPYFAGERTPLFDADARGVMAGLTLRHGRGHMYRAALEATAFGLRHNLEAMRATGATDKRLVAVGGGTHGGLWTQIVSDVLQQPQQIPQHTIGASYGDALLAGIGTGLVGADASWNPIVSVVEPDAGTAADYERLYQLYRDLYPATRQIAHALAKFGKERA